MQILFMAGIGSGIANKCLLRKDFQRIAAISDPIRQLHLDLFIADIPDLPTGNDRSIFIYEHSRDLVICHTVKSLAYIVHLDIHGLFIP